VKREIRLIRFSDGRLGPNEDGLDFYWCDAGHPVATHYEVLWRGSYAELAAKLAPEAAQVSSATPEEK
jgi:hypothetical protein